MAAERLFIFDCDGVLVDSEPLAAKAYVHAYAGRGLTIGPEVIAECIGMKQADIFARIEQLTGVVFPAAHADDIWKVTKDIFTEKLQPTPGITEFLETLDRPRCVASSSSIERILHSLTLTKLLHHFDGAIFSSSMVKRGKPAPDLFLFAAERLGYAPQDCVVIEDSPFGVQAAVAAGMTVLGFTGGGHSSPAHAAQLRAAGAELVFAGWPAIAAWRRANGL
jgi:HAD superfamily hydrolase (TIGR01509 family)